MLNVLNADSRDDLPAPAFNPQSPPRVLLSGVFKPFGVDDAYGRRENVMELFHNQVTKAQGIASLRFQHKSFGLYFIAANINAPTTVLDFPTLDEFVAELKKGYDVVGLSFITPNFKKAREMARLVRIHLPNAKIVLGGHGAAIEGVEELIACDMVAKGEGISWMRAYLGERVDRPLQHPSMSPADNRYVYGIPVPGTTGLLVPGVGCVNACRFCATSHNFGRVYSAFLKTGKDVFKTACRVSDDLGTSEFFVMDENFLKDRERAMELIEEMERANRFFTFSIFSSADTIHQFGVENLVRLGVNYVWMGVESKREVYAKNKGVDIAALIDELQDHGIPVLASGILFLEHHTKENIEEDIDFMLSLRASFVQFMEFTPLPVTNLYTEFKKKGLIDFDLPFEEWHGQKHLNWKHPAFDRAEQEHWLGHAFKRDYDELGASLVRVFTAYARGVERLRSYPSTPNLRARRRELEDRLEQGRMILPAMDLHAHNARERVMVQRLKADVDRQFGPPSLAVKLKSAAATALSVGFAFQLAFRGDRFQPPTHRTTFNQPLQGWPVWDQLKALLPSGDGKLVEQR